VILFQRDNAPAHTSFKGLAAIQKAEFKELSHPLYSQDLALSNYYLFSELKEFLQKHKFADDKIVR